VNALAYLCPYGNTCSLRSTGGNVDFYQVLSRYYDELFPLDEEILSFLRMHLPNSGSLLDLGCGTGTYSIPLAHSGLKVSAIDNSPEMISIARSKNSDEAVDFDCFSMEAVGSYPVNHFDAVLCIGNSLVHLPDTESITQLIMDIYRVMAPGGKVIFQIINYDRILSSGNFNLPSLEREHVSFHRSYRADSESSRLLFAGEIKVKEDNLTRSIVTPLVPLRAGDLISLIQIAGFSGANLYGDYTGEPYRTESFLTVVKAVKPL